MKEKIAAMVDDLGTARDIYQLVEKEDKIAELAGSGFMEGTFGYPDMDQLQKNVALVENECRENFERRNSRIRSAGAR